MIFHLIVVKNVRGIPWTETIHKVADVVSKLGFPLFFTIPFDWFHAALSALVAGSYNVICYQAFVWVHFKKFFSKLAFCNFDLWNAIPRNRIEVRRPFLFRILFILSSMRCYGNLKITLSDCMVFHITPHFLGNKWKKCCKFYKIVP